MEILEIVASYLKPIAEILLGVLTIYGTYLTVKIHKYTKRRDALQNMADQVIAS